MSLVALDEVRLVRLSDEHLASTHDWLQDPALREQLDCTSAPTADSNRAYWHAKRLERTREDYAIVENGRHVGNCGLCNIDVTRRKCELWIYLGERRGSGGGSTAVRQLLGRAFTALRLDRVHLRVLADNPRAQAFYEKLGFMTEGRLRHDTRRDGTPVDSIVMSILADEYSQTTNIGR